MTIGSNVIAKIAKIAACLGDNTSRDGYYGTDLTDALVPKLILTGNTIRDISRLLNCGTTYTELRRVGVNHTQLVH